jgi:hypothetical protein
MFVRLLFLAAWAQEIEMVTGKRVALLEAETSQEDCFLLLFAQGLAALSKFPRFGGKCEGGLATR